MPVAGSDVLFLRAQATKYAWYGVGIAALSVVVATLLVSFFTVGRIDIDGIIIGQRTNFALWVLDAMPFFFAAWGQYASYKMADEADHLVHHKTRDLIDALDQVKISTQAKIDFFSKISHELRSPLNGVIGTADLMADTSLDAQQRRYLDTIRGSAQGLLGLINDILDFSKIEAGKLTLECIEFNLRECVEDAVALMLPQARAKQVQLSVRLPRDIPQTLRGDPGRLRQVLLNLINNAIKFTEHGEVTVEAELTRQGADELGVRLMVKDTGIGMNNETVQNLFKPYTQADSSIARRFGGTGLGLAISKQIVEAMGGEIGVLSELRVGSRFWFSVKLLRAQRPKAANARIGSLHGLKVLVADGNIETRQQLLDDLRALGVEAEGATDGVAALQLILVASHARYKFDVVIADMFLPCMSAEELGRELKGRADVRDVALIMMTAAGSRGDAQRANEIGFAAYLPKPLPREQLPQILSAVMANVALPEPERRVRGVVTRYTLAAAEKRTLRVLVAEDSSINQEILRAFLTRLGYVSDMAADGEQAVARARDNLYDLIFMDVNMPVMDGLEALHAVRAMAHHAQTPVVMLTAGIADSMKRKCLDGGANAVLLKPTSLQELSRTVGSLCPHAAPPLSPPVAAPDAARGVAIFIDEGQSRLRSLREALARGDAQCVAREAHTLKGTSAHFKAENVRDMAARLEQLAEDGSLGEAQPLVLALEQAFDAFRLSAQPRPAA